MINRRFMIVPPALPSGGHAEPLEQTSKDFLCLLLEMANMREPYFAWKLPLPSATSFSKEIPFDRFSSVNSMGPLLKPMSFVAPIASTWLLTVLSLLDGKNRAER